MNTKLLVKAKCNGILNIGFDKIDLTGYWIEGIYYTENANYELIDAVNNKFNNMNFTKHFIKPYMLILKSIDNNPNVKEFCNKNIPIDINTLCFNTGLKSKNNDYIYENDILKMSDGNLVFCKWSNEKAKFEFEYDDGYAMNTLDDIENWNSELLIIGNKFDNTDSTDILEDNKRCKI